MLLKNPLEHILGQASKIRILRFLVTTGGQELNGREIAAAVGLSHVKAHTALKELNRHDVVQMRRAGKSIFYRLNRKNVLAKKIVTPLFEAEAKLQNAIAEVLSRHLKHPAPKSVVLFGSFASDRARPDSDIDVMIVASKKKDIPFLEEGLRRAEVDMTADFGNHLAPLVMDETEFRRRFKKRDSLVTTIVRAGKVIWGESVNDIIQMI